MKTSIYKPSTYNPTHDCSQISTYSKSQLLERMQSIHTLSHPTVINAILEKAEALLAAFTKDEFISSFEKASQISHYNYSFTSKAVEKATNLINSFSISDLASFGKSLAKLKHNDKSFSEIWKVELQKKLELPTNYNTPTPFINILWTLAKANLTDEKEWAPITELCVKHISTLIPTEAKITREDNLNLLWAFGKLRVYNLIIVNKTIVAVNNQIHTFSADEVSKTIAGISKLNYYYEYFSNALITRGQTLLQEHRFNQQQKINTAFYLTMLMSNNNLTGANISNFISCLITTIDLDRISCNEDKLQLLTIATLSPNELLTSKLAILKAIWTEEIKSNSDTTISKTQQTVFDYVKKLAHNAVHEQWLDCLGSSVDILIPLNSDATPKGLVIQVDGPTHHYANHPNIETASTQLNSSLLRIAGYELLRINYSSINKDVYKKGLKEFVNQYRSYFINEKSNLKSSYQEFPLGIGNFYEALALPEDNQPGDALIKHNRVAATPTSAVSKKSANKTKLSKKQQEELDDKALDEALRNNQILLKLDTNLAQSVQANEYISSFNRFPVTLHNLVKDNYAELLKAVISNLQNKYKPKDFARLLEREVNGETALQLSLSLGKKAVARYSVDIPALIADNTTKRFGEIFEVLFTESFKTHPSINSHLPSHEYYQYADFALDSGRTELFASIIHNNYKGSGIA